MALQASQPIGIFDSGIGGLTVAQAITRLLPGENLVYFGDTAHLPYGDKSEAAIQAYSIRIADMLLKKGCKVIVIACNSASSASYELLKEYVRKDVPILNVIDPMVEWVSQHFAGKRVGLIGTKRTVQSGIYLRKLDDTGVNITVNALATPLLAPMIEEGFFDNTISHEIIANYLRDPILAGIDALILACTHYPLIKGEIERFYNPRIPVLDSSLIVAGALKAQLQAAGLLNHEQAPVHRFYVSDYTEAFERSTRIFFGEQVHLERYPLWE